MSNEQKYDSSVGMLDNQKMPDDISLPEEMPQVGTSEDSNTRENNAHTNAKGYKWPFVILIISVVISSSIGFCTLSKRYDEHLDKIVSFQRFNSKELERLFSSKDKIFYNKDFFETLQTKIEEHEASEEALLELSFSKLQSDFNFISLWASVVTIVFLVFSIFSIFRTDEMLKQAQETSSQIELLLKEAQRNFDDIDKQTSQNIISSRQKNQKEIDNFKKEVDTLRSELAEIEKIIKPFNK